MRATGVCLKLLPLVLVATVLASPALAYASGDAIVLMLAAGFEPWTDDVPLSPTAPPLAGGLAATRDRGAIVTFRAVPFAVATGRPTMIAEPALTITPPTGAPLRLAPNAPPAGDPGCVADTSIRGAEGPIAACLRFVVPASWFTGKPVVTLAIEHTTSRGPDVERYNAIAHDLLRARLAGAPVPLETANAFGDATPFVVEYAVDPVS